MPGRHTSLREVGAWEVCLPGCVIERQRRARASLSRGKGGAGGTAYVVGGIHEGSSLSYWRPLFVEDEAQDEGRMQRVIVTRIEIVMMTTVR